LRRDDRGFGAAQAATESPDPGRVRHNGNCLLREGLEAAEAVALEILDAEVHWLASTRATTVIGLKLKASYASTEGKLADSIVEDILHL
jgi:hypothetical protein